MQPQGIIIAVSEDRWDSYGDAESEYHQRLQETLQALGGISDTVDPGLYDFYLKMENGLVMVMLDPL